MAVTSAMGGPRVFACCAILLWRTEGEWRGARRFGGRARLNHPDLAAGTNTLAHTREPPAGLANRLRVVLLPKEGRIGEPRNLERSGPGLVVCKDLLTTSAEFCSSPGVATLPGERPI